jgi:hypothetical protein
LPAFVSHWLLSSVAFVSLCLLSSGASSVAFIGCFYFTLFAFVSLCLPLLFAFVGCLRFTSPALNSPRLP